MNTQFGKSKIDSGSSHWNGKVSAIEASTTIGRFDAVVRALGGEAGYTAFIGNSGADVGLRANVTYVSGTIGPLYIKLGASVDTGVRLRGGADWAVGGEWLGTGITIGRTCKILYSGNELSLRWN